MIPSATPQLLDLAEAMRGTEFRDELQHAITVATVSGWDWLKAYRFAVLMLADETASPRDLIVSAKDPRRRDSRSEPSAEWLAAREALAARDGAA